MKKTEFHRVGQKPKLWSFPFAWRTLLVFLAFCAGLGIGTTANAIARRFCRHGRWTGVSPRVGQTQHAENVPPLSDESQRQHQRAQRFQEAVEAIRRVARLRQQGILGARFLTLCALQMPVPRTLI